MSSLRARPARAFPELATRHLAVVGVTTVLSIALAAWLGAREPSGHRATAVVRLASSDKPLATRVDPVLSEIVVLTSRTVIGNAIDREGIRLVSNSSDAPAGAPREQAIDYMAARTTLPRNEVVTEIDRYISWPGQALAYKMGEIELRRQRRRAEEALGERFDVREFHDAALSQGAVPLNVLENMITAWIAEKNAGAAKAGVN